MATSRTEKPKARKTTDDAAPSPAQRAKPAGASSSTRSEETTALTATLAEGQEAPPFRLRADDGSEIALEDLRGKNVVLYFYPKDNTPGCTREAMAFQESLAGLRKKGAVVLGVSRDSSATHAGFKKKYGLDFPLLTDADTKVHRAYGAWGMKSMYGRTLEGALRTTVLIDREGRVAKIFPSVKVDGHVDRVLAALG